MPSQPPGSRQWPTRSQRLILRAALFDDEPALRAWRLWRSRHDLDSTDPATSFIFPALYLKISRLDPNDPDLPQLRSFYRFAWSRTQMALRTLGEVLRLLQRSGITATILKGIPLVLYHYRDAGARRMYDVDVLIRPSEVSAAAEVLASAGWTPKFHLPPEHLRPFSPACAYGHPQHTELDLHWRPFTIDCPEDVEDQFYQRTQLCEVQGVPARVPDATDLLLFTCFHSRKRDSQAACRWVVDAMTLLRRADPPIDWDQLLERGREAGLLLPIRDTLGYLRREFAAPVPDDVLRRVARIPISSLDVTRYRHLSQPRNLKELLQLHWWLYSGGCRACGRRVSHGQFVRYCLEYQQSLWHLRRPWHVFPKAGLEIARVLLGRTQL